MRGAPIPPRFVLFGAACGAWFAVIVSGVAPTAVVDAGRAWFAVWAVQIAASLTAWTWPFSFPDRYYQPLRRTAGLLPPAPWLRWTGRGTRPARKPIGLDLFRRAAHRIHRFSVDRRSRDALDAATRGAETTHTVSFVCVSAGAIALIGAGAGRLAAFMMAWNVLFNLYPALLQRDTRARLLRRAAAGACPSESVRPPARRRTA
jgi:hypothetical protein